MLQTAHSFYFNQQADREPPLKYFLYLPGDYQEISPRKWPLLLFLHGAGERGSVLTKIRTHGPPRLIREGRTFPFLVLAPQCRSYQTWNRFELLALLDEITTKFNVDTSRVYLTGISMGGYGSWELALNHPERFAAVVPICGGASILPCLLPGKGKAGPLRKLPVWAFHGARDDIVPLSESERVVEALENIGNRVKFTIYPELKHDSWTVTYENPELYDWLLQHRSKRPSR